MFDAEGHGSLNAKTSLAFGCVNILISAAANKCAAQARELGPRTAGPEAKQHLAFPPQCSALHIPYPPCGPWSTEMPLSPQYPYPSLSPLVGHGQDKCWCWCWPYNAVNLQLQFRWENGCQGCDKLRGRMATKNQNSQGNNQVQSDLIWWFQMGSLAHGTTHAAIARKGLRGSLGSVWNLRLLYIFAAVSKCRLCCMPGPTRSHSLAGGRICFCSFYGLSAAINTNTSSASPSPPTISCMAKVQKREDIWKPHLVSTNAHTQPGNLMFRCVCI